MAGKVREVVASKRRTKAGGRVAVSATARASGPKGTHDKRVGHKARNERVVNAVKPW